MSLELASQLDGKSVPRPRKVSLPGLLRWQLTTDWTCRASTLLPDRQLTLTIKGPRFGDTSKHEPWQGGHHIDSMENLFCAQILRESQAWLQRSLAPVGLSLHPNNCRFTTHDLWSAFKTQKGASNKTSNVSLDLEMA